MAYGSIWLIVCCGCYLIWWAVAFHPYRSAAFSLKLVLFLFTLGFGIAGVALTIGTLAATPAELLAVPIWLIVVIAIAVYVILLVGSARIAHRQVTTELALIVGWWGLESALIECFGAVGALDPAGVIAALIVTALCALISLGCYLAYYRLRPMPAYYIAMVPIVLCAFSMAVALTLLQ